MQAQKWSTHYYLPQVNTTFPLFCLFSTWTGLSPCVSQIIDSIMALFRVDFSGRGELAERQQKLAQMLSRLQKISEGQGPLATVLSKWTTRCFSSVLEDVWDTFWSMGLDMLLSVDSHAILCLFVCVSLELWPTEYNVAVFVTNQMTADPGAGMTYVTVNCHSYRTTVGSDSER